MNTKVKALLLIVGVAMLASAATADEVTLGLDRADGYSQLRLSNTSKVAGAGWLGAGSSSGSNGYYYRSLMAFDVDALTADGYNPATHVVTGLSLSITLTQNYGTGNTVTVSSISQANGDWVFGSSSAGEIYDAAVDSVTALDSHTYTDEANGSVTTFTFAGLDSAAMTALVNSWISGTNAGLVLSGNELAYPITTTVYSKYTPGSETLSVTYVPVPEPATMALMAVGGVMMLIRRRRNVA